MAVAGDGRGVRLGTTVTWDTGAHEVLEKILGEVPFWVRGRVRRATVTAAEERASRSGSRVVSRDDVLIALIRITPESMRDGLREKLRKHQVPVDRYEEHFG